jgi:hypothetical protein
MQITSLEVSSTEPAFRDAPKLALHSAYNDQVAHANAMMTECFAAFWTQSDNYVLMIDASTPLAARATGL